MKKLIDDIRNNKIKAVVIHNLDRITRKMKDFIQLIELFEKHNVELISLREKLETNSAMGRFLVGIIILIAEWEADTISERTIRGIDRSAMEGNYAISSDVPLGYRKIGKKLEVDLITSNVIKYMFEMIASNRFTVNGLVKHMELEYSINGIKWSEKKIRKIIKNKLYMGTFENKRISIENHTPAIVTKELWELANNMVAGRSRKAKFDYIFKNRMFCAECNKEMKVEPGTSMNTTKYFYYKCPICGSRISEIRIQEYISAELDTYTRRYYRDKEVNTISKSISKLKRKLHQAHQRSNIKEIGEITNAIMMNEEKRDMAMSMGTKTWKQLVKEEKTKIFEEMNLEIFNFVSSKKAYIIARI